MAKRINPLVIENFRIAVSSIKSNSLRAILTILIIAIGITALVGILTAIEALEASITQNFARMGSNTFSIESQDMNMRFGGRGNRKRNASEITYQQATLFKENYTFPATVSLAVNGSGTATVKYADKKTNPNVRIVGTDEGFLTTSGTEIAQGRNFSTNEANSGQHVAIIGSDIKKKLLNEKKDVIGEVITIGGGHYRIIGVTAERGSSMNNADLAVYLPLQNVRQYFARPNMNFKVSISPNEFPLLDVAIEEAEGLFRVVRNLDPRDESDFQITKSDSMANMLIENLSNVSIAATVIGIITLLGAAIGLMNIMLVAVAERTREIGTRKAIGANAKTIRQQFLFESILIGQLGGLLGIFLGVGIGNLTALAFGSPFIVPWGWIFMGVMVCLVVGLLAGIMPAIKAARLDPIEALRYE